MDSISSAKILDSLFDGVYMVDTDRRITYWNASAERISGYSRADVAGCHCAETLLRHIGTEGCELCTEGCPLAATLLDGEVRETMVFLHHRLGHRVPVSVRTSPVRDESGAIVGAVEIFNDRGTSLRILQEYERLKQEAFLDPLTEIGNRRYGEMCLSTRMHDMQANDIPFGVLFMDIDHFKRFNDRYGHKAGDDVLVMVANSIASSLRQSDVAVRWGGEEFLVIVSGATVEVVGVVAQRVRLLIENSFIMAGSEKLHTTVSIGATAVQAGDTIDIMVGRADRLMYLSKEGGRNRVTQG